MFKVAILGCENSHANAFLSHVIKNKIVDDIEFVGVYSDDREAAEKLHNEYGVPVADSYDQFVGQVDGIVITARHGDNHYKYAKPYLASGIPMFIDKPITCTEEDAKNFMAELKTNNVRVCGGSVVVLYKYIQELKKTIQEGTYGKVYGGFLRAPVNMVNPYGNFHFYCQHLVQVMMELFGKYPKSVKAYRNNETITCIVRYDEYDITIAFEDGNYLYYAGVSFEKEYVGSSYSDSAFDKEFMEFYELLQGHPQAVSYEDFFAPVYIHNAIERSINSGNEEQIVYF